MHAQTMNILVVGATGGSGRATVEELLSAGHHVTAFSRHADTLAGLSDRLHTVNGDATDPDDIDGVVPGTTRWWSPWVSPRTRCACASSVLPPRPGTYARQVRATWSRPCGATVCDA